MENQSVSSGEMLSADILDRICSENLAVYRESAGRLQEDVSQESQVAHDYRGRLVYELLQNADDALLGAATTEDRVLFRLTDDELWVANTGRAFTEADVRGLCGLGASSKANAMGPKRASIGHKGLGFKSVLEITEAPEAFSDSVSFQLGRNEASQRVGALWAGRQRGPVRGVPAMRFPAEVAESDAWRELRDAGFHTAFRFPFHKNVTLEQRSTLANQLLSLPMTSVLFLKHLEEVIIEVRTESTAADRQWLLERHRVTSGGLQRCGGLTETGLYRVDLVNLEAEADRYWVAHDGDVPIGLNRGGLTGPAWEGVDVTEVSVAARAADDPRLAEPSRRFHVFLPTQEPAACSLLVNGAFTTDLSRQHVQVPDVADNYNAHLVRCAARTFAKVLVPHLLAQAGPRHVLGVLETSDDQLGPAAALLLAAVRRELEDVPLLPASGELLTLANVVVPSPILGDEGPAFVRLLTVGGTVAERQFPDAKFCQGALASVAATYGAVALSPVESIEVLAKHVDPEASKLRPSADHKYSMDPVLELCSLLWDRADAEDRQALEEQAREHALFPVGEDAEGHVRRIALQSEIAFYPPQSSAGDLPLKRLRFLAHSICWGSLNKAEQQNVLEHHMRAWDALFDIKPFRFDEVMRAAVLPGLTRVGSVAAELREANRSIEALAAICRLAGRTTKPDEPLPLGRLGSDRAFFNLSRLEVPCRPTAGGVPEWAPAHRVYFGRDWVGDDSIEDIADAMAAAGEDLAVSFLAAPETFAPFSDGVGAQVVEETTEIDPDSSESGEVGIDDDADEALETSAEDRWRNFFAWLGVSRGLRLVHFHDVDDAKSWTQTKDLGLPAGQAFEGLESVWPAYRQQMEQRVKPDPRWETSDHYLYQVHNLEFIEEVAAAAKLRGNDVADRLLTHLIRNWNAYSRHTVAQLALVGSGKVPSMRSVQRATPDEIADAGTDYWLYRLRQHSICPTSHGPRRPNQAWRRSDELVRRLGGRGRNAETFLPVLRHPDGVPTAAMRACLDEIQVRGELTPAAFSLDDASGLCSQIARLYPNGVSEQELRNQVRPIYRQLFELLVPTSATGEPPLRDAPLAARTASGVEFLPARDVVYASVSGSRERSGIQDKVPLFVLEAEPSADRPLKELFGTPLLESALEWSVLPGERVLNDGQLAAFRDGLRELMPPLLARLSADRAERAAADQRALYQFVENLEPVEKLDLQCTFRGNDLGEIPQRTYYVRRSAKEFQGFVVWSGPAWPPVSEDAQTLAMALAETLEVNTVETFLSFINASPSQRRQLLDLAGASEKLDEIEDELASGVGDEAAVDDSESPEIAMTDGEEPDAVRVPISSRIAPVAPAAARVPLHDFDSLLIDGEIIAVKGISGSATQSSRASANPGPGRSDPNGRSAAGPPRAAAGTDLSELDRLGMRITFAFEQRRHAERECAVLPCDEEISEASVLIVDVSSPGMIAAACAQSSVVAEVIESLRGQQISPVHPGFDVLTIVDGQIERMIELKSSGVDAQVQAMSWNEWKTAQGKLRKNFWLYLVGNLRSDLQHAAPFVRAVRDPFGTLASSETDDVLRKRTVQLRVREFAAADELALAVKVSEQAVGLETQ